MVSCFFNTNPPNLFIAAAFIDTDKVWFEAPGLDPATAAAAAAFLSAAFFPNFEVGGADDGAADLDVDDADNGAALDVVLLFVNGFLIGVAYGSSSEESDFPFAFNFASLAMRADLRVAAASALALLISSMDSPLVMDAI